MFQQNINLLNVTIVVLYCETNKIEDLIEFLPPFIEKINSYEKHKAYIVE